MFRFFLITAASLMFFFNCKPTQKESGGFVSLFNGKDLNGWKVKKIAADQSNTYWSVEDGYIKANSMGDSIHDYVWLLSEKEYSNFILKLKFKAFQDSPGNSGVQVLSRYDEHDKEGWLNGPQIDIHPQGSWRTGMMWDETRGNQRWIFPNLPDGTWVDESMVLNQCDFYFADDPQPWNEMKIQAKDQRIEAWLNGIKITDFNEKGILDDLNHQERKVGITGHIALQIHSGDQLKMHYKDIEVKVLD